MNISEWDRYTPEEQVATLADSARHAPEQRDLLVHLLPEQLPLYAGRGANQVIRMRGYLLAAFEQAGLPPAGLPYVLEELESGRDAYLVAAAARALRGLEGPAEEPVPFLLKAIENIRSRDDAVSFDAYKPHWPAANATTALTEIFRTLGWLGTAARTALPALEAMLGVRSSEFTQPVRVEIETARNSIMRAVAVPVKSCCSMLTLGVTLGGLNGRPSLAQVRPANSVAQMELEDQDGGRIRFGEFFQGKPSIAVFFYTRCNNPEKCSLTITKLAQLQKLIGEQGLQDSLKTAALTYDPEFDLPPRLRAYGENRGVRFDQHNRMLRATADFAQLREFFDLGVNFTGTTVNRHRIELFVLDSSGRIAATLARLQWNVSEALALARGVLKG